MAKFYFTYGTSKSQPFFGGWTEVEASDRNAAAYAFRSVHPDKNEGIVNCAGIYSEDEFKTTDMYTNNNNLGYACHERITLKIERF